MTAHTHARIGQPDEAASKEAGPAVVTRFAKLEPELLELLDAISLAIEEKGSAS